MLGIGGEGLWCEVLKVLGCEGLGCEVLGCEGLGCEGLGCEGLGCVTYKGVRY